MFPLTEAWAAEYLEVIVNLLVFALGIPALILQFAVPEQLRIVSSRRLKWLRYSAFAISILTTLSALAFVWLRELHPYSSTPDSTNAGRAGASILTVVVVLILIFWLFQTKEHRRDAIVRRLQRRCRCGLRLRGFLPESSLLDLTYLGEQGDPGREKSQVLNAFDDLAARVQDRKQYAGDGLADLVQGIETTVASGAKTGDLNNFHQVAGVLEEILLRLGRQKRSTAPDAAAALLTLERLGVASLRLKGCERAAIALLQAVAAATEGQDEAYRFASERLFGIGRAALTDSGRFLVAIAALSKLEALAERRVPLKGEVAADLLGLLSHFWASGRTARRHAGLVLERMTGLFDPSLRDCIEAAIEHQYKTAKFDTADQLYKMLEGLQAVG